VRVGLVWCDSVFVVWDGGGVVVCVCIALYVCYFVVECESDRVLYIQVSKDGRVSVTANLLISQGSLT
jgi:hypothetical protein